MKTHAENAETSLLGILLYNQTKSVVTNLAALYFQRQWFHIEFIGFRKIVNLLIYKCAFYMKILHEYIT